MTKNERRVGLYIHIPFCLHKCAYCDFCSIASKNKLQMTAYVDALAKDIAHTAEQLSADNILIDSIYVGGGTPTLLSKKDIEYVIDTVYDSFKIADDVEFTFEANPATIDRAKAKCLFDRGVNRLSIGMQSANDNELEALSRVHSFKDFEKSFKAARKAGFENINVDVMYGIPEQTTESFYKTVAAVTSLEPEHISMYGLRIEDGTPFAICRDELTLPDEDSEYEMYREGREKLREAGYSQYEISNYAREGKESVHNLKYWKCTEYLGVGVAAHSFYGGFRYSKITDVDRYISYICEDENYADTVVSSSLEQVTKSSLEVEFVMLGLRTSAGVNKAEYKARFDCDFDEKYAPRIKEYADAGFIINTQKACMFSPEGMYVSNRILSDILDL